MRTDLVADVELQAIRHGLRRDRGSSVTLDAREVSDNGEQQVQPIDLPNEPTDKGIEELQVQPETDMARIRGAM